MKYSPLIRCLLSKCQIDNEDFPLFFGMVQLSETFAKPIKIHPQSQKIIFTKI